jgi:hypothetical protein
MQNLATIGIASALALGMVGFGCAPETDDFELVDAGGPREEVVPSDDAAMSETEAETSPEVGAPDDAAGADAAGDTAAAMPPTARWICVGDNPGRIGGARNGSEACDDDAFRVTDDLLGPLVVACFAGDQGNGIAFVALNTGPECAAPTCSGKVNDRPRCQGWEKCECENAWDPGNLRYATDGSGVIQILDCPPEGAIREVDLSAFAGQSLWVGAHSQPDGTGRMTEACLSLKSW